MKIPVSIYTKMIEGPVRERERPARGRDLYRSYQRWQSAGRDGFEDHAPSHSQSGCRRLYDVAFCDIFSLQFYLAQLTESCHFNITYILPFLK